MKLMILFSMLILHQHALAQQLKIYWDRNKEDDLAGYKVYVGEKSREYSKVFNVNAPDTFLIFQSIPEETTYFAVTAYDMAGNESEFSEEVTFIPSTTKPLPPVSDSTFIEWEESKDIKMLMVFKKRGRTNRRIEIEWVKFDSTYSSGWHNLPSQGDTTWNWKVKGDTLIFNGTQIASPRFNPELKFIIRFRVRVDNGRWVYSKGIRILVKWILDELIILGRQ